MALRLHCKLNKAKGDALMEVFHYAAHKTGMTTYEVAIVSTHVFQRIAEIVAQGRCVMVPGFGKFGAWKYTPKQGKWWSYQREPFCVPRFYASEAWKNEVMTTAIPCDERNKEMDTYRRNHPTTISKPLGRQRPASALQNFRDALRAEVERTKVSG